MQFYVVLQSSGISLLKINSLTFTKLLAEILIGIVLNLQIKLGGIDILTILSLPVHEHGISLYSVSSFFFVSFIRVFFFLVFFKQILQCVVFYFYLFLIMVAYFLVELDNIFYYELNLWLILICGNTENLCWGYFHSERICLYFYWEASNITDLGSLQPL